MELFKMLILLLTFFALEVQSITLQVLTPVTGQNQLAEDSYRNGHNNDHTANKQQKPLNIDFGFEGPTNMKVTSERTKGPVIIHINNKLPQVPGKIPLVIKTAKAKALPVANMLLKTDSNVKEFKPMIDSTSSKKDIAEDNVISENKLTPENKVSSKSDTRASMKHGNKKINCSKQNLKANKFYVDDSNIANNPTTPITTECTTSLNNSVVPIANYINEWNEKSYANKIEQILGEEVINIDNGTHCIYVKKRTQHAEDTKTKSKDAFINDSSKIQERKPDENVMTTNETESDLTATSKEADIIFNVVIESNKNCPEREEGDLKSKSGLSTQPILSKTGDDISDVISITNHNYEEIIERPDSIYPEIIEPHDDTMQGMTTTAVDFYSDCHQNQQPIYEYLRDITDNYPSVNKKQNWYTYIPDNISERFEALISPSEAQVLYTQTPKYHNNIINHPMNPSSRVWRKWNNTEIKINNPKDFCKNPYLECFRNYYQRCYGDILAAPKPYTSPVITVNGYYNKLNKLRTYPCSYQDFFHQFR